MPTKRKIRIDDCDDGPEQKRARWLCSVDACTSYAVIEGVCNMHRLEKMSRTRCSIGGCKNPIAGCPDLAKMGVCWFHGENQARPRGDVVKPPTVGSAGIQGGAIRGEFSKGDREEVEKYVRRRAAAVQGQGE